jgi:hypothetical protein
MDTDQRGVLGVRVGEEQIDLLSADVFVERLEVLPQGGLDMAVALGDRQLGEAGQVASARLELVPDRNLIAKALGLLRESLCARRILPEVGVV